MSSKQREALSEILDLIDKWRTDGVMEHWQYSQLFDVADKALVEPLRNCEVGTDLEQAKRMRNICIKYRAMKGKCLNCPILKHGDTPCDCFARWSQMPYDEEVK